MARAEYRTHPIRSSLMDLAGALCRAYLAITKVSILSGVTIMIRKILVLVLMLGYMGSLTACNTFEGMGKDVESGGEHVQDAAKTVKKKM